jgi:hypothetical protein
MHGRPFPEMANKKQNVTLKMARRKMYTLHRQIATQSFRE